MGDQPVARRQPTHRTTQTQNKRTQTSMPRMEFEPTTPVFERAKTVHTLDLAATVTGIAETSLLGRAIVEAVSRWLLTAAAWVQSRIWSSGICGGQGGVGAGFLRVLRFPLAFIPPNSPSSQSPGAGTIGQ
jgi:hypothetical protein